MVTEVPGQVADAQPPLRIPGVAKMALQRGIRPLDALAECRVAGKQIGVRNALRAAQREELGRFEAEVLRAMAAGAPIMLERFVGATLGE